MIPANTPSSASYIGNDLVGTFSYPFRINSFDNLVVQIVDQADQSTTDLVKDVDYTATYELFPLLGGTVTIIDAGQVWQTTGKLGTGYTILIMYEAQPSQLTKFRDLNNQKPVVIEKQFDVMAMDLVALKTQLANALQLPPVDPDVDPTFPPLIGNADKILQVNGTETGFTYGPTADEIFTARDDAEAASAAAAASALAASNSAISAQTFRNQALGYRDEAQTFANAASGSAVDAENSANAAGVAETAAEAAQAAAEGFRDQAEGYKDEANIAANILLYTEIVDLSFADSPYTITNADKGKLFRVDTTGGNFVANLPTRPSADADFRVSFAKKDSSGNTITINPFGADYINGVNTPVQVLYQAYGQVISPNPITGWDARFFIENASAASAGGAIIVATQTIGAGGTINLTADKEQIVKVKGTLGLTSANVLPFTANPADGTKVILVGQDDASPLKISFNDADGGVMCKGDRYLDRGTSLPLVWDDLAKRYWEIGSTSA